MFKNVTMKTGLSYFINKPDAIKVNSYGTLQQIISFYGFQKSLAVDCRKCNFNTNTGNKSMPH